MKQQMHLAFDLSYTHLDGRWRVPGSWTGRLYPDVGIYEEVARIAERGCVDMIFFGDGTGIPSTWRGSEEEAVRWGIQWPRHDVSPWIPLMARATSHVGFCLTYASTFMHPFYTARLLNSLDHVTNGRIAFNVITSTRRADAANYGFDELMEHDLRYERMEEFIEMSARLCGAASRRTPSCGIANPASWPTPAKCAPSTIPGGSSRCVARLTWCRRRRAGRC